MAHELIISASGLRGIVGDSLTADVAWRYAAAFSQILPPGPVLVARDGRANGRPFVAPIAAGLTHSGARQVFDAGIAATPTVGVLVRQLGCAGGIQISASHNPPEYNGMKLFQADGRVVPAAVGERVLENYRALANTKPPAAKAPIPEWIDDTTSAHLALIEDTIDLAKIRTRRFRVVLDANHGSGSVLGQVLLDQFGCDVTLLGGTPDGLFSHPPEPTAENLASVLESVTKHRAQIGFCQDPDADRLAIIDENGRYLGEEYTLAICANHVLRQTPGAIAMNCSTSRMSEDVARRLDLPFHRSKVGEANVVDLMLATDAVFGGEGNGGVIDPKVGWVRDPFIGMGLILNLMAETGKKLSELAAALPAYAIVKDKAPADRDQLPGLFADLQRRWPDARSDTRDGLRLDWPDRWVQVRPSNTEPIVRVIAEAPRAEQAEALCREVRKLLVY